MGGGGLACRFRFKRGIMNIEEGYEFRSVHRCLGFIQGRGGEGREED